MAEHPACRPAPPPAQCAAVSNCPRTGSIHNPSPPRPPPRPKPPTCHPRAWKKADEMPQERPKSPPNHFLPPFPAPGFAARCDSPEPCPKIPLAQAFPAAVLAPPHAVPPGWGHIDATMPGARKRPCCQPFYCNGEFIAKRPPHTGGCCQHAPGTLLTPHCPPAH